MVRSNIPGWSEVRALIDNHSIQYIPRNMHTVFALLCFVVVIHWLIFPYPSGLLHWHCGNLTIAPVPAKQPWWIWINTSCEFIMNDCITTTKQSTTKPCAYFLGYTVVQVWCSCSTHALNSTVNRRRSYDMDEKLHHMISCGCNYSSMAYLSFVSNRGPRNFRRPLWSINPDHITINKTGVSFGSNLSHVIDYLPIKDYCNSDQTTISHLSRVRPGPG